MRVMTPQEFFFFYGEGRTPFLPFKLKGGDRKIKYKNIEELPHAERKMIKAEITNKREYLMREKKYGNRRFFLWVFKDCLQQEECLKF